VSDEKQEGRRYGYWLAMALALTPVLYTLSVGPAVYVAERSGAGLDPLRVVYAPLIWVGENTPLGEPLESYVDQWEKAAAPARPTKPAPPPAPPP
jgi:hypothetical protein